MLLITDALRKVSGAGTAEKFQTNPIFKKSIATGKFSSHPLKKRIKGKETLTLQQDKILNIPNHYRRMKIKMTRTNQILPLRMAILTCHK